MKEILAWYKTLKFGYCENIYDFLFLNPYIPPEIKLNKFELHSTFPNIYSVYVMFKGINIIVGGYDIVICGVAFHSSNTNFVKNIENVTRGWLIESNKKIHDLTIEDLEVLQFYRECH